MKPNLRLATLTLLALSTAASLACSCMRPPAPKIALEKAAAVFVGKVVAQKQLPGPQALEVELEVSGIWKGELPKRVTVRTAGDSAACGFPFQPGETYVVYTYLNEKQHHTNLCTRTALKKDAIEDLKDLGEPKLPQ